MNNLIKMANRIYWLRNKNEKCNKNNRVFIGEFNQIYEYYIEDGQCKNRKITRNELISNIYDELNENEQNELISIILGE